MIHTHRTSLPYNPGVVTTRLEDIADTLRHSDWYNTPTTHHLYSGLELTVLLPQSSLRKH